MDLIRLRREAQPKACHPPAPGPGLVYAEVNVGRIGRIYGTAPQMAEFVREYRR
ncbi:hypothetical protein ACFV1W_27400 [Kitasatospora sp. NPDC059648]|uniref:hypothetical protein n=1 Tax=Kitasatospora sp. NPDC059648 TaxID=3346894 RepID=UPI0036C32F47